MSGLPDWWLWPVEISPHAYRRMPMRGFAETDLRAMLEDPESVDPDVCPDRFLVRCRWLGRRWHVILEPDHSVRVVIVVTSFSPGLP